MMQEIGARAGRWAAVAMLAGLAGCASMSEQECRTADWYDQGMREAQAGYPKSRIEDDREACAKVGVVPNVAQYMAGFDVGIRRFCTPQNGARWGRDGHSYQNSCPADLEPAFVDNYRNGRRAYDAEQTINRLRNDQMDRQRKLDASKDDKERERLRRELRDLDQRLRDARDDLERAERRLRN